MNTTHITDTLADLFQSEDRRIVFWHDPDGEFEDFVRNLSLDGVQVVLADEVGSLELKVRLERDDPQGRYLLYFRTPEPEPENDWLLDIRLYSKTFRADWAAILLGELGLANQSMRPHLQTRKRFFAGKDRLERIKRLVAPQDREADLDLKLLAVLVRAEHPAVFDILMRLFGQMCTEQDCDVRTPPAAWADIEKFGLAPFFWEQMAATFGYREDKPGLADLLIRLLVTDLANSLHGDLPGSLTHFRLPDRPHAANASVFIAQWRSHLGCFDGFSLLSRAVARDLRIEEQLESFGFEPLQDVMTFEACERLIIRSLRDKIVQHGLAGPDGPDGPHTPEHLRSCIQRRKDGHWTRIRLPGHGDGGNVYSAVYDGLAAALDLLELRKSHDQGFSFAAPLEMFQAYTRELYRFDQSYRLFHEAADQAELAGWDVLKEIQQVVESCYNGWFLDRLAMSWGGFLGDIEGGDKGLLALWKLEGVANQHNFHSHFVKSLQQTAPRSKVFVIVSDALRYEIAEELAREINAMQRFKADLNAMLGVLPGYTGLGMAALLPRQSYGYKEDTDQLLVDDQPCASLDQRAAILARHEGVAVRADDLLAMNKDQGRDFVRQARLVAIYHNQVDAVGDDAATERKTFTAARKAVEELLALVRFIVNSLNGAQVLITADHGFLYQDSPPTPLEKSALADKPDGLIKAKKRYVLGRNLGTTKNAWCGRTSVTAGTRDGSGDMEFWVPKGVNRFHFTGGARFVHGGTMLQEVVVPVIQVRELEGKAVDRHAVRQANVSLLGSTRRIVNAIQRFEFIQTERVSERVQPRTVVVSIRDGDALISNEETITFNSTSELMEERKRSVRLMLKKGGYNKKKEYALVLRDPDTMIELERIPMTIDLAFENDF